MGDFLAYLKIFGLFFSWYYKDAPRGILKIWRNFILFVNNYFSITLLLKTLFAPWRKITESYGRGFDIGRIASALTLNILSRAIGFIIRSVTILLGLITGFFVLVLGAVIFISWFFLPFILIWALFSGFTLI